MTWGFAGAMTTTDSALVELRHEIDTIDDQLHDLLLRRAEVVTRVARVKAGRHGTFQPGREAVILRRLAARHQGPLPLAPLVRMWRELLSATARLQGDLTVAVYAPPEDRGLWDVARDHFGSTTPFHPVREPVQAVRAVVDDTATLAVVPWPDSEDRQPWWRTLLTEDAKTPRVVARLPFLERGGGRDGPPALAIARTEPEPTGDDHTLVSIALVEPISRGRIKDALATSGLPPFAFWSAYEPEGADRVLQLVEIVGFVPADDPRLRQLLALLGGAGRMVRPIGGFALPLVDRG